MFKHKNSTKKNRKQKLIQIVLFYRNLCLHQCAFTHVYVCVGQGFLNVVITCAQSHYLNINKIYLI